MPSGESWGGFARPTRSKVCVVACCSSLAYSALASFRMGMSGSDNESPNLHPIFLCERWNDTVQAQVLDKLSVMVGNVPDRDDRDAQFGVRPGIAAFNTVERIVRRERGEDAVRVVEGVLEIPNQLSFGFRRIVPTLFAVLRR